MKRTHTDIYKVLEFSDSYPVYCSSTVYADRIDILWSRARLLKGRDRAIMSMYLDKGNSLAQIARVAGLSEAVISRRVRKLMVRLTDGEFILCLQHRDSFEPIELSVAKDFFLVGLSQSTIAERRGVSLYKVRKAITKIKAFKKSVSKKGSHNV